MPPFHLEGSMSSAAVTATTVLRLAEKVSLQPLGEGEGGVILRLDSGELFTVNDTALSFVAALDGSRSVEGTVQLIVDEYEVDREMLTRDLIEIASDLLAAELVEQVG
jgi:pyrroloquinoline quinone biosynthesis protein D